MTYTWLPPNDPIIRTSGAEIQRLLDFGPSDYLPRSADNQIKLYLHVKQDK